MNALQQEEYVDGHEHEGIVDDEVNDRLEHDHDLELMEQMKVSSTMKRMTNLSTTWN